MKGLNQHMMLLSLSSAACLLLVAFAPAAAAADVAAHHDAHRRTAHHGHAHGHASEEVEVGVREEEDAARTMTDFEKKFLDMPDPDSASNHLRYITSEPHVAGTSGDYQMAEYVKTQFQQYGIPEVHIDELQVMLNYMNTRPVVQLRNAKDARLIYEATLMEDKLPSDETTDTDYRFNAFHGYAPSGSIHNAPMVYANYGRPQDFDVLQRNGISVHNAIVIVRYGKCFRGLKVQNAQQRGALGVLIYSDPADDGASIGPTYPDGPWRPESGFQRGSVQFNSLCGGDPRRADRRYGNETVEQICGYASEDLIPSIPSLPMNMRDVRPLLQNIGGPAVDELDGEGAEDFQGGLSDVTYRVGPSIDALLTMEVDNVESIRGVPNVIGKIPGRLAIEDPGDDMPILLGNHRDAWVYGAADPNSGTAALLEVAKGLGALVQDHGWQPERSIYLLSWSGEEYGLLGSTGWGELNGDTILSKAVAYLNLDTAVSGNALKASATPSLTSLWKEVLQDLQTSNEHSSEWLSNGPFGDIRDANTGRLLATETPQDGHADSEIGMLGSGSDYTVFLDHLGIASLDFSFHNPFGDSYGQYHSIYDSFTWVKNFGGHPSPAHAAFDLIAYSAKIWGLLAMRLGSCDLIPLDHMAQANSLVDYVATIEAADAGLDVAELRNAVSNFKSIANVFYNTCERRCNLNSDDAAQKLRGSSRAKTFDGVAITVDECNEKITMVEREFLIPDGGLPRRPWFKHVLQAPGMHLGYAAEAFPGIQQALDDGDWDLAKQQVKVAADRVQAAADFMQFW